MMNINLDKEAMLQLNSLKIALNNKPSLLAKTLNNDKTLVVVIDMINGFVKKGALASPRVDAMVPEVVRVLDLLPEAQFAFVRDEHTDHSAEMKWFPPHAHTKKESALIPELAKYTGIDLPKNSTNGLFSLQKNLPDFANYQNFLVMGCCTDICVLQFSLALRAYLNESDLLHSVIVLTDCVETYDSSLHPADLCNLFSLKLMEDAGVQLFKTIS